jgi:hypothetical protein
VRSTFALSIAPVGPLVAGVLLDAAPARVTVGMFAGFALLLALWGTSSPALRSV